MRPLEAESLTMQDIVTEILILRARNQEEEKEEETFKKAVQSFDTQLVHLDA